MKERPILYSTPMVVAVKTHQKTQTRRLKGLEKINSDSIKWVYSHSSLDGHVPHPAIKYNTAPWYLFNPENTNAISWIVQCPYGQVGDILWVRETWSETTNIESLSPWPNRPHIMTEDGEDGSYQSAIIYRADGEWQWLDGDGCETEKSYWKPSIHMKKIYSRIRLIIVSIKIEKLNDITEEDSKKEGVINISLGGFGRSGEEWKDYRSNNVSQRTAKGSFKTLWININGEESWESNPWVWVIEFKVV